MVLLPDRVSPRRTWVSVLLFLFSLNLVWARPPKSPTDPPETLVAIGDVHGDFDDFSAILQQTRLVDKQSHWAGGKTTLVQVGDLLDRGPKPRQVMDLMMSLQEEAPKSGGRVVSLLGNHEMMNLMGDLRYVTAENYASFADRNSEDRRKVAYQEYAKWRGSHAALLAELPQPMELTEAEWMARHPAGFVEQREAFAPNGKYGKWVRARPALVKIGGVLFLHGGIQPDLTSLKLDAINDRIHDDMIAFDSAKQYLQDEKLILPFFTLQEITAVVQAELAAENKSRVPANPKRQAALTQFLGYPDWLSVRSDGPLWFRGYDQWSDQEGAAQIGKVLDAYKAEHIVVGHTVQKGARIRPRFDGKVFLIDTGMLGTYYPGGKPSALEIQGDAKFTADYMDQQVVLVEPAHGANPAHESQVPAVPQ